MREEPPFGAAAKGGLSGRTVLVTGASGFIGAALTKRLRDEGAAVHGLARRKPAENGSCQCWWEADVADLAAVRRVVDAVEPDLVCHLAGLVAGTRDLEMVVPMVHANLVGAVNLLVAVAERGRARLLLAGSLEEAQPDGRWPVPASPYAAAKLAAGAYARMFHAL